MCYPDAWIGHPSTFQWSTTRSCHTLIQWSRREKYYFVPAFRSHSGCRSRGCRVLPSDGCKLRNTAIQQHLRTGRKSSNLAIPPESESSPMRSCAKSACPSCSGLSATHLQLKLLFTLYFRQIQQQTS